MLLHIFFEDFKTEYPGKINHCTYKLPVQITNRNRWKMKRLWEREKLISGFLHTCDDAVDGELLNGEKVLWARKAIWVYLLVSLDLVLQWRSLTSSTWRSATGCWRLSHGLDALTWRLLPPWCRPQSINPWVKVWRESREQPLLAPSCDAFGSVCSEMPFQFKDRITALSSGKWEKGKCGICWRRCCIVISSDFMENLPCSCLNFFLKIL